VLSMLLLGGQCALIPQDIASLDDAQANQAVVLRFHFSDVTEHQTFDRLLQSTHASDVWASRTGSWADVMVSDSDDMALLMRSGLRYTTQVADVDSLIQVTSGASHDPAAGFSDTFHSAEEIHGHLEALAKKHPKRARILKLSQSVHGKPIHGIQLGAKGKPEIMILGGQHAREWISPAALTHVVESLLSKAELGESNAVELLDSYQLTITPLMNPDGYDYSRRKGERMWRKNLDGEREWRKKKELGEASEAGECFGVDLNRNWLSGDAFKDGDTSRCQSTFEGAKPFSEPETKGLKAYIQEQKAVLLGETKTSTTQKGIIAFVDVHSYGEDLILPGCDGRAMTEAARKRHTVASEAVVKGMNAVHNQKYSYGSCQEKLSYGKTTGIAGDWAHFDQKIPYSLSIEARSLKSANSGGYGFVAPAKDIRPVGEEISAGIHALAKVIRKQEGLL